MENRICYVFGAAALGGKLKFRPEGGKDLIVAADAGYRHLQTLGLTPDLLVGDFDSLGRIPEEVRVQRFPAEKDDTDLALAVRYGFERGYRDFIIYGALGGRLDFTYANFQLLAGIVRQGGNAYFVGCGALITAIRNGTLTFDSDFTGRISIFCSGSRASGVTLRGLKYPLVDAVLQSYEPLGVSNEFLGEAGAITVRDGTLIVIYEDRNNRMKISESNGIPR